MAAIGSSPSQRRQAGISIAGPEAELKPAAFAFRRRAGGLLGSHGRIIRRREEPEQGRQEATVNVGSIADEPRRFSKNDRPGIQRSPKREVGRSRMQPG